MVNKLDAVYSRADLHAFYDRLAGLIAWMNVTSFEPDGREELALIEDYQLWFRQLTECRMVLQQVMARRDRWARQPFNVMEYEIIVQRIMGTLRLLETTLERRHFKFYRSHEFKGQLQPLYKVGADLIVSAYQ